ncbi:MAG: hypothetical protein AAGK04_07775 [Planctomycetota bacterium]
MSISAAIACSEHIRKMQGVLDGGISNEGGRALSASLRLLITESLLRRAWREVSPGNVSIRYPDISRYVRDYAGRGGVYAFARAIDESQLPLGTMLFGRLPKPRNDDGIRAYLEPEPIFQKGSPESFAKAVCCILDGVPIRRESLIKYVANHAGGIHHGKPIKEGLREYIALDDLIRNGVKGGLIPGANPLVGDVGCHHIYYEVFTSADAVLRSPRVLEKLSGHVDQVDGWPPDPNGDNAL